MQSVAITIVISKQCIVIHFIIKYILLFKVSVSINNITYRTMLFALIGRELNARTNHGVDWEFYYNAYKKFLPYITNNYDFSEMLSEMLGELNASHTGSGYRGGANMSDQTASLGLLFDYNYTGKGINVAEVIEGGPVDKAASKIKPGTIIEQIDGMPTDSIDFYQLLNRKINKLTLLSLYNPAINKRWEESVKPISSGEEGELLYKRWVKNRRNEVEQLSNGKIGYIHDRHPAYEPRNKLSIP